MSDQTLVASRLAADAATAANDLVQLQQISGGSGVIPLPLAGPFLTLSSDSLDIVSGKNIIPAFKQIIVYCENGSGAVNLQMTGLTNSGSTPGYVITVLDYLGQAATHNITIYPPSGGTINGSSTYVISSNRGAVSLITLWDGAHFSAYTISKF